MGEKGNRRNKNKRPNKFLYLILGGIVTVFAKFYKKQKVVNNLPKELKSPFIVIGNHSNFFDFIYVIRALYPRRVNFIVARKYFHFQMLSIVMKFAKAIPKSLSQPDIGAIASILQVLKEDGIVGIYPEGQIAIQGFTNDGGEAIAKLVKKAGVPVVRVLTVGAYFCDPPWAKSSRRGKIESKVDMILSKEDIDNLSVDEIKIILQDGIHINNHKWQRENSSIYKGKLLAEGLENILYLCPSCKEEFKINTYENKVFCENCSITAEFKEDGHFHWHKGNYFEDIGQWHKWQLEIEIDTINNDDKYSLSETVTLAMIKTSGNGIEVVGEGTFTVNEKQYIYHGTVNGDVVKLTFETSAVRYIPFDSGNNFQIYNKNLLYEFRPNNPVWCMKIANICEALIEISKSEAKEKVLL